MLFQRRMTMREQVLTEIAKSLGRWLDEWKPAYRNLGRACSLVRRGLEHPEQLKTVAKGTGYVADLRLEYDPERFLKSVESLLRVVSFEDSDMERITQFLREQRSPEVTTTRDLLEWLGDYRAVVRTGINNVESAQFEALRELRSIVSQSGLEDRPPSATARRLGPTSNVADPAEQRGKDRTPCDYLGLSVDPVKRTVRRLGYPTPVRIAGPRAKVQWNFFLRLYEAQEEGCYREELEKNWEKLGGAPWPSKSAVWDVAYRLREKLRPLDVDVGSQSECYSLVSVR
jgi:hypothetical protein